MSIIIRKETQADYKQTEHMTMRAFWNIHGPGCNEHLLAEKSELQRIICRSLAVWRKRMGRL